MTNEMGEPEQVDLSSGVSDEETIEYMVMTPGQYFLQVYGFQDVYNVAGGIDAYARSVDSSITRY